MSDELDLAHWERVVDGCPSCLERTAPTGLRALYPASVQLNYWCRACRYGWYTSWARGFAEMIAEYRALH